MTTDTDGFPLVPLEGEVEDCPLGNGSFKENDFRYYPALARLTSHRLILDYVVPPMEDETRNMLDTISRISQFGNKKYAGYNLKDIVSVYERRGLFGMFPSVSKNDPKVVVEFANDRGTLCLSIRGIKPAYVLREIERAKAAEGWTAGSYRTLVGGIPV